MFPLKYLYLSGYIASLSLVIYLTHKYDNIQVLKSEILQLQHTNSLLNDEVSHYQYALQISESTNERVINERDTIIKEDAYQKTLVQKYQTVINNKSHIDPTFVWLLQQSKITNPTITPYPSSIESASTGCPASGVLLYINALKSWGEQGWSRSNQCVQYYNNLKGQWNK